MAPPTCRRRRCLHCNELYKPDARNRTRQRYCSQPECRQASKRASQARWLAKPGNADYFRGEANTERNRRWRQATPGYWKRSPARRTQQDRCSGQLTDNQEIEGLQRDLAQQDPLLVQLAVFVGLIAKLTDSTQQETIDGSVRRLHALGKEVLSQSVASETSETTGSLLLSCLLRAGAAPNTTALPP